MVTRMMLAMAALGALTQVASAGDPENDTLVRMVKYKPIAAELAAADCGRPTPDCRRPTPQIYHRRPAPPSNCPKKGCVPGNCGPDCAPARRPEVEVGSFVTAPTNFLGKEAGHVLLKVGCTTMECSVIEWCPDSVKFQVPNMGLSQGIAARFEIVRVDGTSLRCYDVCLVPKPGLYVQPVIEASPASTPRQEFHAAETDGLKVSRPTAPEPAPPVSE